LIEHVHAAKQKKTAYIISFFRTKNLWDFLKRALPEIFRLLDKTIYIFYVRKNMSN
jgi:hypothetical protein